MKEINKRVTKELRTFDQLKARLQEQGLILPFFSLREITDAIGLRARQLNADPEEGSAEERLLLYTSWKELESMQWLGSADGPLWYRGYSKLSDADLGKLFAVLKKNYHVERFVTGHTPVRSARIKSRLGGRFFLIDTGMLVSHYRGQASALQIKGNAVTEIYPDVLEVSSVTPRTPTDWSYSPGIQGDVRFASWSSSNSPRTDNNRAPPRQFLSPEGSPATFRTHDEVEQFLRSATIVSSEPLSVGITKPFKLVLEKDGVTAHAVFHYIDESKRRAQLTSGAVIKNFIDSYRSQMAAYEIARSLGLDNVPPTIIRSVNGRPGSVQLWIEGAITEKSRVESLSKPLRPTYYQQQLYDKEIFHSLINNIDPNQGNILWDEHENIWLIDHTRSLGRDQKLFRPARVLRCSRELWNQLNNLNRSNLQETLIPRIGRWDVKALLARLDLIIDTLQKKIDTLGETRVLFTYGEPLIKIHYTDPQDLDSLQSSS